MNTAKKPWMKFYPADWRGEPRLRMCSFAARGLWIDLMSYMHEGTPYGHLTIEGHAPDLNEIASLTARPVSETRKALAELDARKVFSRSQEGTIYSRRMVRDADKAMRDKENGKAGGNPSLKPQVNPPDKAHIPETRDQKARTGEMKNLGNGGLKGGSAPPHCATQKINGRAARVFIKEGTPEWEVYSEAFREKHGNSPVPNKHGGKWFDWM